MSRALTAVVTLAALLACGGHTFVEPPLRPAADITPGLAKLSWENGVNSKATLIARTSSMADPTAPVGDVDVGATLGDATVLAYTDALAFTDNKLPTECGPFAWHLWGRGADGTWSKTASTVRSALGQHTLPPTAEVTGLTTVPEGSRLHLYWTLPDVSTGFKTVTVVRKNGTAPTGPNDGTVVYEGPSDQAVDQLSNLSPGGTWYAVFNCNACGKCGTTATTVQVSPPSDGGVTLDVSNLSARISADRQHVELSWTATAPVKVLRTVNAMPSGPTDINATLLFDGTGSMVTERLDALLPHLPLAPQRYRYTVWACAGTHCSATPASVEFTFGLKAALQGGGYALFFQHATATQCTDKTSLGTASTPDAGRWWTSCDSNCTTAKAAQLSPGASDVQLANISGFFADAGVQVSRLATSEFCRAVQTGAGFRVDAGVTEQLLQLTWFVYDEPNRCRDTSSIMNAPVPVGQNSLFVGHGNFMGACTTFDALLPADCAVFKPQLGAPPKFVARVGSADWATVP
ncbi:MAG: hypothetical protein U0228_31365 [Myxococcaceae bacterium]